jgi:hypothetical protein
MNKKQIVIASLQYLQVMYTNKASNVSRIKKGKEGFGKLL